MTKKDFFRIIIKLFGLYWLVNTLYSLSQIIYFATNPISNWWGIFYLVLALSVAVSLFVVLIFKSDFLIRLLKLDLGFDNDNVDLPNFNTESIVVLGLIILGGIMVVDNIAIFMNQTYLGLKAIVSPQSVVLKLVGQSDYQWAVSFTKIIVGYVLLTNYPFISKYLLKITQK